MINHRGEEFRELILGITQDLKQTFQTQNDVLTLTASGTGGLEAAIVNTLSPGDRVLALSIGVFGDRFSDIASQFGAEVEKLDFEWGSVVHPEALERKLKRDPKVKAVMVTHNETSTGVTNDLETISQTVKKYDKLLLVDAVSSLSCINLPTDLWGCDIVITASQKGWMSPPGLAMVSISEKGWEAVSKSKMPRYYWDFLKAKSFLEKGQTPWTPAISTLYALSSSLKLMKEEGLANIIERHARVGNRTRRGIDELGLSLFPQEAHSNTVTAVNIPSDIDSSKLLGIMRRKYNIVLAGGQQKLKDKIFRIGHMGWVCEEDIDQIMAALKEALPESKR
jgi:aspartate aminotransferase-like enzyme